MSVGWWVFGIASVWLLWSMVHQDKIVEAPPAVPIRIEATYNG